MSNKKQEKKENRVEIPQIGEPLENPNFINPTALSDPLYRMSPRSLTDPLGMWTGRPESPDELPVQDADDL